MLRCREVLNYGIIREDGTADYIDNILDEPERAVDVMADAIDTKATEVVANE